MSFYVQFRPKKKLDKIDDLCIIDSDYEGRLFNYDNEKNELLFSGYSNQEAEGDQQENRPATLGYFKTCD